PMRSGKRSSPTVRPEQFGPRNCGQSEARASTRKDMPVTMITAMRRTIFRMVLPCNFAIYESSVRLEAATVRLLVIALEEILSITRIFRVGGRCVLMTDFHRDSDGLQDIDPLCGQLVPREVEQFQMAEVRTIGEHLCPCIADAAMSQIEHLETFENA